MKAVTIDELIAPVGSVEDVERWDVEKAVVGQNHALLRGSVLSTAVATAVVVIFTSVTVTAASAPMVISSPLAAEMQTASLLGDVTSFEDDDIIDPTYWSRVRQRIALARERLPAEVDCEDPEPII